MWIKISICTFIHYTSKVSVWVSFLKFYPVFSDYEKLKQFSLSRYLFLLFSVVYYFTLEISLND